MANDSAYISVTDYKFVVRELRKIEPQLAKDLRKDIRKVMKPLQESVSKAVPSAGEQPKGMVTKIGRLSWETNSRQVVPANRVLIDTKAPRQRPGSLTSGWAKLRMTSAPTVLADMAGRSGKYIGLRKLAGGTKKNSMEVLSGKYKGQMGYAYTYRNGVISGRIHRNTGGQGRGLISALGKRPSRYGWPAALKGIPATRREINRIFDDAVSLINSRLRSK